MLLDDSVAAKIGYLDVKRACQKNLRINTQKRTHFNVVKDIAVKSKRNQNEGRLRMESPCHHIGRLNYSAIASELTGFAHTIGDYVR
jgi:hypothetical protein